MTGKFLDWRLNLWGECIDPSIQELHPLPDEHDDDHEVAEVPVSTTSLLPTPSQTDLPATPSDHIDRPINAKPSNQASATTSIDTPTSVATSTPTTSPTPTHTPSESFLPSFFPTFGVSKRTQIWIYGSFGLIAVFCCALGVYFFVQRKKRLRNNPRDDYEFEALDDHDDDGGGGMNGHAGGKRAKRRAGELYDAFAGESDEEVFSDVEEEPYTDAPHRGERLEQSEDPQISR
jgi:kexin